MVKARLKKRKPPARLRYEASHPVVTLRLPLETHGRLKAALAALGCTGRLLGEAPARPGRCPCP